MKRQPEDLLSKYTFGSIPPQNTDIEEAVLGACLVEQNAVALAIDLIKPEYFYVPNNQTIFEAITQLFKKNDPIDILTVSEKLKDLGKLEQVGGIYQLSILTNKIASTANTEAHCYIIIEKYIARTLINYSSDSIKGAYDDSNDIFDLIDDLSVKLLALRQNTVKNKPVHIEQVANENMAEIKLKAKSDKKQIGVQSGIKAIDEIIGGFLPQLYIVAGRPGSGKSSLVTSCLKNIAVDNLTPCGVFSLEMTKEQVELRLKTIKTGISNIRLIKGDVKGENEWEQLYEATEEIAGSPIFIDDSSAINIVDLRSKIINLIAKYDIKIVFIDYIQRMQSAEKGQKDLRLITNEITNGLARIAKDLKIPVVALSQLSRSVESTKDKMPELHHLKESGNIEEDAYCVMFIYRPEYYGLPTFANDNSDVSSTDKAQVLIAKHRNGSLGEPIISFIKSKMLFEDLDSYKPITQDLQAKINQISRIEAKGKEEDFIAFNDF